MIRILSKDSIEKYIVPYLSVGKRGGSWHDYADIVSAICTAKIKWGSLFYHFRKWVKDGSWQPAMNSLISQHKRLLGFHFGQLDGTHTAAKRSSWVSRAKKTKYL
ncbi:hypothetical protein [Emticicia fontis]